MTEKSGRLTLKEAIEVLKERSAWIKQHFEESTHAEAIDTVVAEFEKPKFTLSQMVEIFAVAKAMTEHLDEKGRNEYFDNWINFWKEKTK